MYINLTYHNVNAKFKINNTEIYLPNRKWLSK